MDRETVSVQPSLLGALFGWILVGHVARQQRANEAAQQRHEEQMLSEHQRHEEDMLRARDPEAAARLDVIKAQRSLAAAVAKKRAKKKATIFAVVVLIVMVAAAATLIYVSTPEPVELLPARPTAETEGTPADAAPVSTPEPVEPLPEAMPVPAVDELWTLTADADVLRDMDSFVPIATVHKGRSLHVIGRSRRGGFLHVRLHDGREGWVDAERALFVANWIDDPSAAK